MLGLGLGGASVACALAIGLVTYRSTIDNAEKRYLDFYLDEAKLLAATAGRARRLDEASLLRGIQSLYMTAEHRPADEYICIVNRDADLILHTADPDIVGQNAGGNAILSPGDERIGCLRDLARPGRAYVGRYVSTSGQKQIAAFVPIPGRQWTLGLHRSYDAFVDEVHANVRVLAIGFASVCGVLMPLSLFLLTWTFRTVEQRRKAAAESLRQSEQRYATAQHAANIGSWEWDIQADKLQWSEQIEPMFGFAPGAFGGTYDAFLDCVHPDDRQHVIRSVETALEQNETYLVEHRIVWPDGQTRWVSEKGEIFRDDSGQAVRMIGIVQDVTERKQAEEEKVRLQEQLHQAQKMDAVGQMAGGVAHDFNNLLMVVMGSTEMIRHQLAPGHPALDFLKTIDEAARQATGVASSLLTFSRRASVEKKRLDLGKAVRESARMLHRLLPASIELVVDTPCEETCWVEADRTQLQQIVVNLSLNARDAMPHGGVLRITVRPCTEPAGKTQAVCAGIDRRHATLSVSDTGTGIAPELRSRLFEPFFTTKARGRGTGLGLSIIHSIVQDHGGCIEVESSEGQGSTFTVILPCAEPETEGATAASPVIVQPRGRGQTILLAEDQEQVRQLMAAGLQSAGYAVIEAADGRSMLECFHRHREQVALIIADVDLPGMSGVRALGELRALGVRVPAIVITGAPDRGMALALDDQTTYLTKPFSVSSLADRVHDRLTAHSEANPTATCDDSRV